MFPQGLLLDLRQVGQHHLVPEDQQAAALILDLREELIAQSADGIGLLFAKVVDFLTILFVQPEPVEYAGFGVEESEHNNDGGPFAGYEVLSK